MLVADAPLGFRFDGRPIWPFLGGSEGATEDDGADDGDDDSNGSSNADTENLSDAGRRAIERERADAKAARDALRPWRVLAKELGVKGPEEIKSRLAAITREQADHAAAIDAARQEVLSKANTRIVKSEIKALAADLLADTSVAPRYLDVSDYEVDDDGNVDTKKVQADLKRLLAEKPHLARVSKKVDYEGGARKSAQGPVNMNDKIRSLARRG